VRFLPRSTHQQQPVFQGERSTESIIRGARGMSELGALNPAAGAIPLEYVHGAPLLGSSRSTDSHQFAVGGDGLSETILDSDASRCYSRRLSPLPASTTPEDMYRTGLRRRHGEPGNQSGTADQDLVARNGNRAAEANQLDCR
jgi:hypothetical protein